MATRLLLARHGQTEWHAENRYAGSSEVALTAEGLHQAEALAGYARDAKPTALFCSPQQRAIRTMEPTATALGMTPTIVEGLRESHFGIAEGRTREELRETDPVALERFLANPVDGAFPGSEPPAEVAARGVAALREVAAAADGGTALVVAHNTLLRLVLCAMLGIPLRTYRTVFPRVDNVALTELRIDGGNTALLRFNTPVNARY
ncbi:histidine phosphatase family protein [Amycolatopsis sp. NPDC059027]|uniref:histidine phosphatase family protein n=1 Tax=Amycolatopsis sp. NPDC059027 TaxID=3346709 RepID=UPI00366E3690